MSIVVRQLNVSVSAAGLFRHLYQEEDAIFLDSSLKNSLGRYSIIGLYPYLKVKEEDGNLFVNGQPQEGSLKEFMGTYLKEHREENCTPLPMVAGAVGYMTYDYGRQFERIPSRHKKNVEMPEALFCFYDLYIIEDLTEEKLYFSTQQIFASADDYEHRLQSLCKKNINGQKKTDAKGKKESKIEVSADFEKAEYLDAIDRMIRYIIEGDIYIANMTRQICIKSSKEPYQVFEFLRRHNPSPFGGYCNYGDYQIVSASPERFLRIKDNRVETRPIKGTRRRGADRQEDERLKEELAASEKDKSELLMIVDLERNDLNRACKPGSVEVTELFAVETYATVFHLVSTIRGTLDEDKTVMDLIEASFPGGSITGAPKIRAMEIIDELEHSSRGLYTGSMGYLSLDGSCDLNIVIRTAVFQNGVYHLGVGGGITAESELEFEYEETAQKAKAILEAVFASQEHAL